MIEGNGNGNGNGNGSSGGAWWGTLKYWAGIGAILFGIGSAFFQVDQRFVTLTKAVNDLAVSAVTRDAVRAEIKAAKDEMRAEMKADFRADCLEQTIAHPGRGIICPFGPTPVVVAKRAPTPQPKAAQPKASGSTWFGSSK